MQGRHRPSGLRLLFSSHLRGGFQQRAVPVCRTVRQVIATYLTHDSQNYIRNINFFSDGDQENLF